MCQSRSNALISTSVFVAADKRFLAGRCLAMDYSVTICTSLHIHTYTHTDNLNAHNQDTQKGDHKECHGIHTPF
jgi:hypothetical protein